MTGTTKKTNGLFEIMATAANLVAVLLISRVII